MSNESGLLIVVAAASGTGKSTVCRKLLELHPKATVSISYTTRAPRGDERDGEHYHFVCEESFRQMIEEGALLEWAEVHGNYYGTSKAATEAMLGEGRDVLLDIDVQGARSIRDSFGQQAVLLFLLPPSWEAMVGRLRGRGTESEEKIQRRLQTARQELPTALSFDYLLVNDDLDETAQRILHILSSERLRPAAMKATLEALIEQMGPE